MKKQPIKKAVRALSKSIEIYRQNVQAATLLINASPKKSVACLVADGSLDDDRARLEAGTAFARGLVKAFASSRSPAQRRTFLATFCWDEGIIPIDGDKDFDINPLKHKIYKALRTVGLHGIAVIEIVPFRKSALHDELLYAHGHVFCWTDDLDFKPNVAAKLLRSKTAFNNSLGFPSVTFRSRRKSANLSKASQAIIQHLFSDLHQDQTKSSLAWLGYYLFQAPSYVKHAYIKNDDRSKISLRTSYDHLTPELAIKLRNTLAGIKLTAAVFGIGEGRQVRSDWIREWRQSISSVQPRSASSRAKHRKRKKRDPVLH